MKYTAFSFTLIFLLSMGQSQTAEAFVRDQVSEDISFFQDNFQQANDDDCYVLMIGDVRQGDAGRLEIDINQLRRALGDGPTVVAEGTCKPVASMESVRMLIVYNNESEVEYPVEKLADIKTTPGISERLLLDAKEVRFVDIRVKDSSGIEHELEDQTFFILS